MRFNRVRYPRKSAKMKRIGTVSYNIYCNFTNYGSALQTWALHQAIKKLGYTPVLVDYCPDILADKNPLNPFGNMWDKDEESRRMVELTMPAIRENYRKFDRFYHERFTRTSKKYTSSNFNDVVSDEKLDGFVCGSDTIFCIEEFQGFDDGYYANFDCMKKHSIAYAASFGSAKFDELTYPVLNKRLRNFKAIGLRENRMLDYVSSHSQVPCARNLDPTLLLSTDEYKELEAPRQLNDKYLLLYSRRYDPQMEEYARRTAEINGLRIVEISLRSDNSEKGHIMRYDAGVEEFLTLTKYADFVVTNSFHGLIFAVQYKRPMTVFFRSQATNKISELLSLFGMNNSKSETSKDPYHEIDYNMVHKNIEAARQKSHAFLRMAIGLL